MSTEPESGPGILLDSSFLIAYHNRQDTHHAATLPVMKDLIAGVWGRALLLEYVFLEVVTVLLVRRDVATVARVGNALLESREIEFVPASELFLATFDAFRMQSDSRLSFVDAALLTLARRRRVRPLATFDSDFAGFDDIEMVP